MSVGKKVFVGSLPTGIQDATLRATFQQYGQVEDIFIKPNCDPGRQWAFVTFATTEQAQLCKSSCDRVLQFPGSDRPCDVIFAKNQGLFGQAEPLQPPHMAGAGTYMAPPPVMAAPAQMDGPKKIFVGSLPDGCTEQMLRVEFSKFGTITEVFLKSGCEPGRQWAFVSYASAAEAQYAKVSTDRILLMPGGFKACEVTLARNQGLFGQDAVSPGVAVAHQAASAAAPVPQGPKKIFVGSLPDHVNESLLRQEFERYGQVTDVFIKTGCESGRQWAFITFASHEQASYAKESTDRVLVIPGADRPCEVMLARNQGKFGQDPVAGGAGGGGGGCVAVAPAAAPQAALPPGGGMWATPLDMQPPPPVAPPPAHLTPWRCYYTAAGLPYYHNHATGLTQWEAPPELRAPGDPVAAAAAAATAAAQARYSPY